MEKTDLRSPLLPNPRARPARRRSARLLLAIACTAAIAATGYYGWDAWASRDGVDPNLLTVAVQRGDLEDTVTATGTLQPRDFVDVGTQVSGQLRRVHVQVGSTVAAGDLLAEIDPTLLQARADASRAQLRGLRAQLEDRQAQRTLAQQQLTRQRNLLRENATTTEAAQTAEASVRSLTAQIEMIRAQIEQTESTLRADEANLKYARIHAPIAGTVVSQTAKEGQTLNATHQAPVILRIADLSTMTVQAQVSEADVSRLKVGMDVYFTTLGSQGRRWHATLRRIEPTPEIVNSVVLYNALFDVPNPKGELMTQMTAQVFFVVESARDVTTVPVAALRPAADAPSAQRRRAAAGSAPARATALDPRTAFAGREALVQVVGADGHLEERKVRIGLTTRVAAEVVSGLQPGERVVAGLRSAAPAGGPAAGAPRLLRL
ncbi:MAG TPA: efflux RND transporter periplasmic adaptor subunit [Burkholderiaceae bacterium]|nr:efflux RND transporter periplasmic adaptor subunit [Burkholderiaceae bacterium]